MIKALHPSIEGNPRTYLTIKANAAQADLVVQNASDFDADEYVVIGEPGQEQTEIKKIGSVSGNTLTLSSNLGFSHPENTKITFIKYNQVKFYRANTESGEYSLQTTKSIAIDEPHTLYDDPTGTSTQYYKIRYYNSTSTDISPYSAAMPATGFARYALMSIQNALIKKYGDKKETFLDRDEIADWVNEWKDERVNELAENNEKQFIERVTLSGDGTGQISLEDDFKKEQKVEMAFDGVEANAVRARRFEVEDIDDKNQTYSENEPYWAFNNYKLEHRPKGTSSLRVYLTQVFHPADLSNDSDTLPKPLRFYLGNLMDFLMHKANEKDGKEEKATYYFNKYLAGAQKMIEHENNLSLDENREVRDTTDEVDIF
jgi:hypothetical protein